MCHGRVTLPRSRQVYCRSLYFTGFPWLGIASYATLMNRWRESNPLMCELKLPIRLTAYQRSLSRHEQNTKNMAT